MRGSKVPRSPRKNLWITVVMLPLVIGGRLGSGHAGRLLAAASTADGNGNLGAHHLDDHTTAPPARLLAPRQFECNLRHRYGRRGHGRGTMS